MTIIIIKLCFQQRFYFGFVIYTEIQSDIFFRSDLVGNTTSIKRRWMVWLYFANVITLVALNEVVEQSVLAINIFMHI